MLLAGLSRAAVIFVGAAREGGVPNGRIERDCLVGRERKGEGGRNLERWS